MWSANAKRRKDRPYPDFAIDYFYQMRQQYELLLNDTGAARSPLVDRILANADASPDQIRWADVFALESAYSYALPDDRLAAEVILMRARYRSVAGADVYERYALSVEIDTGKLAPKQLRAELLALAERIRYLYTFVPPKEHIRNQLAQNAAWLTLAVFAVAQIVSTLCLTVFDTSLPTILLVVFAGVLGGFLSVQRRLNQSDDVDPLLKELQLREGWFSVVVLAPLSGAVFACVLYWLFLAGLLRGGLFPTFDSSSFAAHGNSWKTFVDNSAPSGVADYGKLLVWSFIAGFAERFVPNVLTRLTGQATSGSTVVPVSKPSVSSEPSGSSEA